MCHCVYCHCHVCPLPRLLILYLVVYMMWSDINPNNVYIQGGHDICRTWFLEIIVRISNCVFYIASYLINNTLKVLYA